MRPKIDHHLHAGEIIGGWQAKAQTTRFFTGLSWLLRYSWHFRGHRFILVGAPRFGGYYVMRKTGDAG